MSCDHLNLLRYTDKDTNPFPIRIQTHSPQETETFAQQFAHFFLKNLIIEHPFIISLEGDLGAGKTLFARAFIQTFYQELQPDDAIPIINSPTYNILNHYPLSLPITHIDCYRLEHFIELEHIGIKDYLQTKGIFLLEWASKIQYQWDENQVNISFSHNFNKRVLQLSVVQLNDKNFTQSLDQWLKKHLFHY